MTEEMEQPKEELSDTYVSDDIDGQSHVFRPQEHQRPFMLSTAPFVARVAPWADGKRIDISESIRTTDGWKKLEYIEAGDEIFGIDGKPTIVMIAHDIVEVPIAYRLRFDSGETVLADPQHLWYTLTCAENQGVEHRGKVRTTQEIIETLKTKNDYESNHRIPVAEAIECTEKELPIKPYTLGAWLGDGNSNDSGITITEEEIAKRIENDGYVLTRRTCKDRTPVYGVHHKHKEYTVTYLLKQLNILKNKHIPFVYLDSSIEQRMELLRGLMDTDGFISKHRGMCEYCSISKKLADGVLELVGSLGIKARIWEGDAAIDGRFISRKYRVCFKTKKDVFSLSRKKQRLEDATSNQLSRHTNRFITEYSVEHNVRMRCLTVDAPDGLFLVGKSFIPTHNTLCAIMKGMMLSQLYPKNEGLILRKRYNALQRSTMRDFTKWTGLNVPEQKKSVIIPGCESTIHFAHCENMEEFKDGIQGMNLGWVYIEQGDELETADIFEMLLGRLRRILTPNAEVQRRLWFFKETRKYFSTHDNRRKTINFERLPKEARNTIERVIVEKLGLPVRQIMIIANACGHNWIWKRWNPVSKEALSLSDGYEYFDGKPFENKEYIPETTLKNWEVLRKSSPKKYNRYVMNSHEDYDIEGAYYAGLMSDALKERRIELDVLYDRTERVWTFWDLGVSDETAIWFVQFIGESINLIDYYSNNGEGIEHYSDILNDKGYTYGGHYLPHDAEARIQADTITTRLDILKRLRGKEYIGITEKHSVAEGIQAVRSILNKCKFSVKCEKGVECLNYYHRDINKAKSTEEETFYLDRPSHDKWSHGADAFRMLAVVYRYTPIDGQVLGQTARIPEQSVTGDRVIRGVSNLLEVA